MSVTFSYDEWDRCDLQWITASAVSGGAGLFAINWQNTVRGGGGKWIAWSITTADSSNVSCTIQVGGNPIIQGMGVTDGQIYSPANMPDVPSNMPIVVTGTAGIATTVFFNVLIRRPSS